MILDHILRDKDKWKADTIDLIKKDLLSLSVEDSRFIQYNQTSTTHLVCLYGKSQVGKTTLILNMIGLREECKEIVSDVLRGGVKRGNSSTSTAILYSQNCSMTHANQYGIKFETLDSHKSTQGFEYCNVQEMKDKLQSVRDDVENNKLSSQSILHISIPNGYFLDSVSRNKISILDLPGVESRNTKEKAHVESLMARYIPISSVCIITCLASTIQSLEKEELPNNIDWKSVTHKYLVVLTKSYCDGSIKKFFNTPRQQRKTGFKDFVQTTYKTHLFSILGANNHTQVFPLDIGDSFDSLLTNELQDEKDCSEVKETRDAILSSLQETIIKQKGEHLMSTIEELRAIVDQTDEKKIESLKNKNKELVDEINKKNEIQKSIRKNREDFTNEKLNVESKKELLDNLKASISALAAYSDTCSSEVVKNVKKVINEKKLSKDYRGEEYFNDKNKFTLNAIHDCLTNQINVMIDRAESLIEDANSTIEDINIKVPFFDYHIVSDSIYKKFCNRYEKELYPDRRLFDKLFNRKRISLTKAYNIINSINGQIRSEIESSIIGPCNNAINKEYKELDDSSKRCSIIINKCNKKIKSIDIRNASKEKEKEKNIADLAEVEKQKKHDQQTLDTYLRYAHQAYLCQRNGIIRMINSEDTTQVERLCYTLLLGVIDRDYKTIINVSK